MWSYFCSETHRLRGRWAGVRWHGAGHRDRGFSRGQGEALSRVWGRGQRAGPRGRLQMFGTGYGQRGLLGEHGLAGALGRGSRWRGESRSCREIETKILERKIQERYHNLPGLTLSTSNN